MLEQFTIINLYPRLPNFAFHNLPRSGLGCSLPCHYFIDNYDGKGVYRQADIGIKILELAVGHLQLTRMRS
jgi:hypothetical protein